MAYPHIESKEDYEQYKQAVEDFLKREEIDGFTCGRKDHDYTKSAYECETYFSWAPCECCQRALGGNRHDVIAFHEVAGILEYAVCDDCVYYAEYGKLDDLTMLKLEEE